MDSSFSVVGRAATVSRHGNTKHRPASIGGSSWSQTMTHYTTSARRQSVYFYSPGVLRSANGWPSRQLNHTYEQNTIYKSNRSFKSATLNTNNYWPLTAHDRSWLMNLGEKGMFFEGAQDHHNVGEWSYIR